MHNLVALALVTPKCCTCTCTGPTLRTAAARTSQLGVSLFSCVLCFHTVPYQIPRGTDWCNHAGSIHQDVPGCGRVCSDGKGQRGVKEQNNWPSATCSSCPGAEWASCSVGTYSIANSISPLSPSTQGSGQGCPAAPQGPQDCKPSTLNFHILPLV